MQESDYPDDILPAQLIYVHFKDKYTGLPGAPVPMYVITKDDNTVETITKMEYFRRVLVRKVNAKYDERKRLGLP